jgi:transcriptional regulator with XRE-family HTH domain
MIAISKDEAQGRVIGAGRMLAGLDQGELGRLAGVSASTVSNIERGRNATPDSIKAVRKALRDRGVNLSFGNDQAIAAISFIDRNADDEE